MSIKISQSAAKRTTASKYDISRWTNTNSSMALYKNLANESNPQMRGSDNLMYNPTEMLGGGGKPLSVLDPSYKTVEMLRAQPAWITAAAFILFLGLLKYLRS